MKSSARTVAVWHEGQLVSGAAPAGHSIPPLVMASRVALRGSVALVRSAAVKASTVRPLVRANHLTPFVPRASSSLSPASDPSSFVNLS